MNRKIAVILAAIIIPGGFIALIGGWLMSHLAKTEKGRKVVDLAKVRTAAFTAALRRPISIFPMRQAA